MAKVDHVTLDIIKQVQEQWVTEVESSDMTDHSKATYRLHVRHFVRWLDDDFEPGARVAR